MAIQLIVGQGVTHNRIFLCKCARWSIMGVQALAHPDHRGHLWGDVPTLFLVAAVLALLMPRGAAAKSVSQGTPPRGSTFLEG